MAGPKPKPGKPKPGATNPDQASRDALLKDSQYELDHSLSGSSRVRPKPIIDAHWKPLERVTRNRNTRLEDRGPQGALYDSRLQLNGAENAELTITLRIFFQRLDPTAQGGYLEAARDGNGVLYKLEEITNPEFDVFRREVCRQANETWNSLCLVTPNDFVGFDWPRLGKSPMVRPNINCRLRCEFTENFGHSHATVYTVAPSHPKNFISYCHYFKGGVWSGIWDIHDAGIRTRHVKQDPAFWWFNKEDIEQRMIPHETGHLIGLQHIGEIMRVGSCLYISNQCSEEEALDAQYGSRKSFPMWLGRDIMGHGSVVHACDATPWMYAMEDHTQVTWDSWIPAGCRIPPRAIKDIPKTPYTLQNSPYQGGFQEVGKY